MNEKEQDEFCDLVLTLQAEVEALKRMMFETNPALAARHQALADQLKMDLFLAWRVRRDKN